MASRRTLAGGTGALALVLCFAGWQLGRESAVSASGVPVGTVLAFTGERVPAGWLLCDGRSLRRDEWPGLYRAIGTSHGAGVSPLGVREADFNLPDYRGRFLRGVDAAEDGGRLNADLGADLRFPARPGGNAGNRVGSYQPDATAFPRDPDREFRVLLPRLDGSPVPVLRAVHGGTADDAGAPAGTHDSGGGPAASRAGSDLRRGYRVTGGDSETRPRNVSVKWIIRARP